MYTLRDVYGTMDQAKASQRVREIANWIESLPLSNIPFVEMGFDALPKKLIA